MINLLGDQLDRVDRPYHYLQFFQLVLEVQRDLGVLDDPLVLEDRLLPFYRLDRKDLVVLENLEHLRYQVDPKHL
jgi:hypothetical protein